MKITQATVEKDGQTGRNKIMVEIDSTDILIIQNALAIQEETGRYDKDDSKYKENFDHVKNMSHEVWKLLWPS